ncbi:hypothetical protein TNCV_3322501 [Trichonephila clavipes]|nr:hypothetical protein TNCV_3322501 [Trichonephila clavipes]
MFLGQPAHLIPGPVQIHRPKVGDHCSISASLTDGRLNELSIKFNSYGACIAAFVFHSLNQAIALRCLSRVMCSSPIPTL